MRYVFIAVRLVSVRLPRKALLPLSGVPALKRLLLRLSSLGEGYRVVVCTSTSHFDDEIQDFCVSNEEHYFRGAESDVMARFISAAEEFGAENFVRVTGDNPLTDPEMLSFQYDRHLNFDSEYTYNEDLPVGTRCEIIRTKALKRIHPLLRNPLLSEYMTFMLKRPDKLKTLRVEARDPLLKRPDVSVTLDTFSDYEKLNKLYLDYPCSTVSLIDVINWMDTHYPSAAGLLEGNVLFQAKGDFGYLGD